MVAPGQEHFAQNSQPVRPDWLADWWSKIASALAILSLIDVTHQVVEWAAFIHAIVSRYAAAREWLFSWLPFHIPPDWHNSIVLVCVVISVTNIGFYRATGQIFALALMDFILHDRSPIAGPGYRKDIKGQELVFNISISVVFFLLSVAVLHFLVTIVILSYWSLYHIWAIPLMLIVLFVVFGFALVGSLVAWTVSSQANSAVFGAMISIVFLAILSVLTASAVAILLILIHVYQMTATILLGGECGVVLSAVFLLSGILLAWRWILGTGVFFMALIIINEVYVHWPFGTSAT